MIEKEHELRKKNENKNMFNKQTTNIHWLNIRRMKIYKVT